jgi:hypothetical protein
VLVYDPAEQGPEAGAPMPDAVDGFDSVKQRPYVGMPMTSFSLGAPRDTQYSADQFCGNSSDQIDIQEQLQRRTTRGLQTSTECLCLFCVN